MSRFIVTRREVWTSSVLVEAKDHDEAIKIVGDCGGVEIDGGLEYSHTLDTDTWTVESVTEEDASKVLSNKVSYIVSKEEV